MFEGVMVHDLRWRLQHRAEPEPAQPAEAAPEVVSFQQRDRVLFDDRAHRPQAPPESHGDEAVPFRQRGRHLFQAFTGAPPEGGEAEGPQAVPFRQRERRIFSTLFGGAADLGSQAGVAAVAVRQRGRLLFDAMVAREGGRRVARRGAWTVGAATFQVFFVSSLMLLTAALAARSGPDPEVQVKLVQPAFQRPAPPPPPPAPPRAVRRAPATPRPSVATVKPQPPGALIQPREIAEEMKAPDPNEPIEEYQADEGQGVEGGVVGGVPGYAPPADGGVMEAPQYVTTGFRAPAEAVTGCVGSSVRLPPELAGYVAGQVVVKFAVGRDGSVGLVQLQTPVPDPRIAAAIRHAIESCRWRAGSDAQGRAVTLWVVLPLRFSAG